MVQASLLFNRKQLTQGLIECLCHRGQGQQSGRPLKKQSSLRGGLENC
ncbi:hypothetical protein HMPREF1557_01068 [Streptococcus sobrinus W1703]|uniref:Uncharacterized protein n=1 Tax=Streptococcus sobrinus W1703 TaxID=1227275 RepID=U2KNE9_9STRE|nr:hypothetical protein HMPREF1557_01068 [Streptococcus sobrinus W1703]